MSNCDMCVLLVVSAPDVLVAFMSFDLEGGDHFVSVP
jgi:hypothetical protein